jgi:CubicO group peptidase (beta-lactamase class C family)
LEPAAGGGAEVVEALLGVAVLVKLRRMTPTCAKLWTRVIAVALLWSTGCASGRPDLHWQGGDVFGVTSDEGRAPIPIACTGTQEQRFLCYAELLRERAAATSGAFAVVDDTGQLHAMGTGEPAATLDTPFALASITKMFTAATAVRLSQRGVLDLMRPISSYLSELGVDSELGHVTVHQLLTHTAGLLDPPSESLCSGDGEPSTLLAKAHVAAPPGALYVYSNAGYALAGIVIERVTGHAFEDAVREQVLEPMGMVSATFDPHALTPRVLAAESGGSAPTRCRAINPAGGLIASLRDLARWAQAMSRPETHPLGRALAEALVASHVPTGNRVGETYGYGVTTIQRGALRIHCHGGNLQGSSAFVAWLTDRKFAALAAATIPGASSAIATLRGTSLLLDLPDDWRPTSDGPAHPLQAYVGTYIDQRSKLGRIRISIDQDKLVHEFLDGPPPLLPAKLTFHFAPEDNKQARYLATAIGIAERAPAP